MPPLHDISSRGGLTPAPDVEALRVLWRRSQADRDLVQAISALWEVAS
jgi:hypothetical protein